MPIKTTTKQFDSQKLKHVLNDVCDFVRDIHNGINETKGFPPQLEIMFSDPDDGCLWLSGEEADRYRTCFESLVLSVSEVTISRKALEDLLHRFILSALDINNRRIGLTLDQRLNNEKTRFLKDITAQPRTWHVYHPIGGLQVLESGQRFGKAEFYPITKDTREQLIARLSDGRSKSFVNRIEEELAQFMSFDEHNPAYALIKVSAIDHMAAIEIGLNELRTTVDVVNFYADLVMHHSLCRVTIPGELTSSIATTIALDEDDHMLHMAMSVKGSRVPLPLRKLDDRITGSLGIDRMQAILESEDEVRTPLEKRLLTVTALAGQASVAPRKEEAFLLYAIALESLVLAFADHDGLSFRLKMYVPHLLGKSLSSRQVIMRNVNNLYGLRSRLVHNGNTGVTESDLAQLRYYAKATIVTFLDRKPLKSMKNFKELQEWLDEQILQSQNCIPNPDVVS